MAAAEAFSAHQGSIRKLCFIAIWEAGDKGLTTAEVEDRLGRTLEQRPYDPRIAELRKMGRIEDSGQKRMGRCGIPITVWVATEAGVKAFAQATKLAVAHAAPSE